jgi:hypothetical protein
VPDRRFSGFGRALHIPPTFALLLPSLALDFIIHRDIDLCAFYPVPCSRRHICYHSSKALFHTSSDLNPKYLIAGASHEWDSYGIHNVPGEPLFIQLAHLWKIRNSSLLPIY